jgi:hypothetical protein
VVTDVGLVGGEVEHEKAFGQLDRCLPSSAAEER